MGQNFSVAQSGLCAVVEGEVGVFISVVGFILRVLAHGNIAAGEAQLA
jgi:hypothetical protein